MSQTTQDLAQLSVDDVRTLLPIGSTFTVEATKHRYNPFSFPSYEAVQAEVLEWAGELAAEYVRQGVVVEVASTSFSVDTDQLAPDILATVELRIVGFTEAAPTEIDPEVQEAAIPIVALLAALAIVVAGTAWVVDRIAARAHRRKLVGEGLLGFLQAALEDLTSAAVPIAATLAAAYLLTR